MRFLLMTTALFVSSVAQAHDSHEGSVSLKVPAALEQARVSITQDSSYIYIKSNGLPDHKTGNFPNRSNPNRISEQSHDYRVPLKPRRSARQDIRGVTGVALNGIPFEPGTAEFWNNDRNWNYEALSSKVNLGLDDSNAHVQPNGTYHYHGIPWGMINAMFPRGDMVHVGYASDGFKIYVSRAGKYRSSYRVKRGQRSGGPSGAYDGTFTADYEYVDGSGHLDACNGFMHAGEYVYVATEAFPQLPRCAYGSVDQSFERRGGGQRGAQGRDGNMRGRHGGRPPPPHHRRP